MNNITYTPRRRPPCKEYTFKQAWYYPGVYQALPSERLDGIPHELLSARLIVTTRDKAPIIYYNDTLQAIKTEDSGWSRAKYERVADGIHIIEQ